MALYVFSDAHLGSLDKDKETEKLSKIASLFEKVKADGDRLVILGDLFDFWFEYKHVIPKEHHEVLFMLSDLIRCGVRIDYVSGNHDFWLGDFFSEHMGIRVYRDSFECNYDGKRIHFVHGDGLAKADRGYRFLKRVLRNPVNIWLYRKLPPDWAIPLAKFVSGTSRKHTSHREYTFAPDYEMYAREKLADGFDIVAIGHLHLPTLKQFDGGFYVNSGDFIEHFSFVRLAEGNLSLEFIE